MWVVVSVVDQEKRFTIVGDKSYVVGRIGCDITINDPSVSRKQAVLTLTHLESNVVKSFITPTLSLEDKSKFGTFVNGKSVRGSQCNTVSLKDGDEIQFGGSPISKYKAVYESFIATTSCLEKAPKKSLQKIMCLLGGHVVRDWRNSCDLLIMSRINVTIKVICAINNQKHIVTPVYLEDFHKYLLGQKEKPEPVDYLPEVVDKEVPPGVSFHPDTRRVTLLSDLKFFFLSALQFNKTNMAVSTAGGLPILLEDGTDEDAESMTQEGTIVVSVSKEVLSSLSSTCQRFVRSVCSALKKKNLRMVTDPEIGWAILTCNTSDFCNPKSAITPSMYSSMASQTLTMMEDTDSTQQRMAPPPPTRSHKRSCEDSAQIENTTKEDSESLILQSMDALSSVPRSKKVKLDPVVQSVEILSETLQSTTGKQNPEIKKVTLNTTKTRDSPTMMNASDSTEPKSTISSISPMDVRNKGPEVTHTKHDVKTRSSRLKNGRSSPKCLADDQSLPKKNEDIEKSSFVFPIRVEIMDDDDEAESRGCKQSPKAMSNSSNDRVQDATNLGSVRPEDKDCFSETKAVNGSSRKGDQNHKTDETSFLLDDSDDDEDISAANYAKTPKKKSKANCLFDDSDESPSPSNKKRRNHEASLFDSDDESKKKKINNLSRRRKCADNEEADELVSIDSKDVKNLLLPEVKIEVSPSIDSPQTTEQTPSDVAHTWVSGKTELKSENGFPVKVEKVAEVFYDKDGQPTCKFCEVKVMDLVARPSGYRGKKSSQSGQDGVKNFKKFRKVEHIGSGQLPKIIGGRDLQPHIGSKLQALDGLLPDKHREERQGNHKQKGQLFGWDD